MSLITPGDSDGEQIVYTQNGRIASNPQQPRVGLTGPPGMQIEVALTKEGFHGVVTILGGSNLAAAGFPPRMLRAVAGDLTKAADQIEARHGRDEAIAPNRES